MAKNLMLVGTASSAGKSLMAAAFCRIFSDEGYKVSPFKSQNMALNSYITQNGKEMGRAQVVQAEAARTEPVVEMNPILLKPTSHKGSQVIVMGTVYGNTTAWDYYEIRPKLKTAVINAYKKLEKYYDIIIIEGAGSPAEINLKKDDFVNMGMAEMVNAPVILVADIDKGGVFASIYGTIMLLNKKERGRIKGFIINKFRGDVELLKPGIKMIEKKIKKPCLGVVPFMDINVDDEDSVTERFYHVQNSEIRIGVIRLPYISNFTDFTAFEITEGVSLKYINKPEELENIDLLIIPGSKNTIEDMKYLKESGLELAIKNFYIKKGPIIGICGGFQILGKKIKDPYGVESSLNEIDGLSLLDVTTEITKKKTTRQFEGQTLKEIEAFGIKDGVYVKGYEIHMGICKSSESFVLRSVDGREDGAINKEGTVFGTYVHGIFDNDILRIELINWLRKKKGLNSIKTENTYMDYKQEQYDKLAHIVKKNIEFDKIKNIMGIV